MDARTKRLIAVGASVGANCHPCLEYHIAKAQEMGISAEELREAVEAAQSVRGGAAAGIDRLALRLLGDGQGERPTGDCREAPCCCT